MALFGFIPLALALDFPTLSGRVVDEAAILDQPTRAALTQKLADFEAKTSDQLVVVTLKSLQGTSIEDFGVQLARHWKIGQKGTNNGALLIVVPSERKVRIEVGYGLEGALTDAVSRFIIENSIVPRFRANDFPGGIRRGVDDIIQVLSGDADEWKRRAAKRPEPKSDWSSILMVVFLFIILVLVFRTMANANSSRPGRGRRGGSPWVLPIPIDSGSSWSSGSSGGGFDSGGGFSGGGGSFGGGGASGSW